MRTRKTGEMWSEMADDEGGRADRLQRVRPGLPGGRDYDAIKDTPHRRSTFPIRSPTP
jgi:hypothetical protein